MHGLDCLGYGDDMGTQDFPRTQRARRFQIVGHTPVITCGCKTTEIRTQTTEVASERQSVGHGGLVLFRSGDGGPTCDTNSLAAHKT